MEYDLNKNCFDFLRAFFAFNVLLSHVGELSQSKQLSFLQNISNSFLAINGFFIISGFLVAKSYSSSKSIKKYFVKRIKRIVPAYVFVILFFVVIFSFFSTLSIIEYFSSFQLYSYLGWNLIFLNFMEPCLPGLFQENLICAVNGALWTIKVEESFYLILPVIFYFFKKFKSKWIGFIIVYIVSYCFYSYFKFYLDKPLIAKQMPGVLTYFGTGVFIFLYFPEIIKHKIKFLLLCSTLSVVSYIYSFYFLFPVSFGFTVILSAYTFSSLNNFGKYGDFTYGLYIFHFPLIQLFRSLNLFERFNPYLVAIVVVLMSILFAILSWFFIEKRFISRFNDKTLKNAH
ncbi:acyltransferase family protein [Flavobacterium okayamense]|uniref:Acyltransferase n=1 Tax=Flavobacterium okayamense TaxID=2830782 RepID=A0ABM7S8P1_9FLAO|nr:acyltransferase [Flavobacterium okayamense]BCY27715.1 acyltransferase [Flavobacterium okayamense]